MADSQTPPQPTNGSQKQPAPSSTAPESTDATVKNEPDLDASIEQDIDMNADPSSGANADESDAAHLESIAPAAPPSKKETSLREFLSKMDDYAPIVSSDTFETYLFLPQRGILS